MTDSKAVTTNAAPPPTRTQFRPMNELSINDLLADPRVHKAMSDVAPKHLTADRMLRVMIQALRKTPKLGECSPLSLMGAMISCAALGLEPNTPLQMAHLIPFEKRGKRDGKWVTLETNVNLIIGYPGLIDLARRTGTLVSIHADVVYEGDEFSYEYGSNMHLRHVPSGVAADLAKRRPTHAYAHAKLSDGEAFEVLPYPLVLKIRDATQAYQQAMRGKADNERNPNDHRNWASTPWIAYEHEMACKTMVRRLAKWLPKSIEFSTATMMDSMADRGMIDFSKIAHDPALAFDPEAAIDTGHVQVLTEDQIIAGEADKAKVVEQKPPAEKKPETAKVEEKPEAKARTAAPKKKVETPPPPVQQADDMPMGEDPPPPGSDDAGEIPASLRRAPEPKPEPPKPKEPTRQEILRATGEELEGWLADQYDDVDKAQNVDDVEALKDHVTNEIGDDHELFGDFAAYCSKRQQVLRGGRR
jgi:recombination protein RecT